MQKLKVSIGLTLLCFLMLSNISFAQLTGIKYIGGTAPDYTNLENAINDLNSQGVGSGGVTFLIRSGTYAETDNLIILDVVTTESNPVVFQPDTDAIVEINITITGDNSCGFKIHNSDYISFNGTPYESIENSRNMTINGIRNNEDDIFVIWIANGSDHITLENLIINSISEATDTGWSTPVYCSTYEVPSPLVGMDSFTLSNCEVIGGSTYGVFMDGDTGIQLSNFNIINNTIHDFQKYGIHLLTDIINCNVEGNEVYQTFAEARSSVYGIRAGSSSCSGTTIHHNYIHDLWCSSTAKPYGIFITSNSHHNLIYNNIIYLCPVPTVNKAYGIYRASTDYTYNEFYYNTVYMGGNSTIERSSYCFCTTADFGGDIFKNNILINERTGGGNNHYAIKMKTETFDESDFNFLTVNSDDPADDRFVAQLGSIDYNTLADLQSAPGYAPRDENSITGDPDLSFPNLHLNSTSLCIGAGTPITGITTDFDYDLRDEVNPDIGADEFISNHAPVITYFFPEEIAFSIKQNTEQLFSITAEDPDEDSLFYFWYLDDIQQSESSYEFTYTFSDTGDFVVKALVSDGELADSTLWDVTVTSGVAVDDNFKLTDGIQLYQNTPNPFIESTKISFLATDLHRFTQIKIYNVTGQLVKNLECGSVNRSDTKAAEALYSIQWDGTGMNGNKLPSGIYFYRLKSDNIISEVKKMVLIR
ncbi:MAG: T9SS type A sorting domain-containing protein [Candidatus Cloacimonetes bacterium]|nr:T9SS type A sorting domain-containing protein [Candidatus Cloacimonadota bacterium]